MKFTRLQRYLLSILGGVLMVLSFPFTGSLFPLAFVAWVPLLLIEHNIYREKYKSSKFLLHAYIVFLIYNAGASYWVFYSIGGEAAAILAYFLNGFLMALVLLLFHWTKKYVGQKEGYIGFLFYWVGFEYIHYIWELSWPWLNIGNTFARVPEIVQWYSYSGILGGTFWILIINLLVFKIVSNVIFKKETLKVQTPIFIVISLFLAIPIISSLITYYTYEETNNPLEVIITQPNIDPYNEKFSTDPDELRAHLNEFVLPAEELLTEKTAFVLAPETAISMGFNEELYFNNVSYQYLQEKADQWNVSILTGASTYKIFEERERPSQKPWGDNIYYESYNSSMLITPSKPPVFLHKTELVLGVEKIPFVKWFPFLEDLSVKNGGTSGTLGVEDEPMTMTGEGITFAPVICYESVYGGYVATQERKGAQVIFLITNDGWWENTAGHTQHAAIARLRAVEGRRYVARSANTGISCVINQRGDVVHATKYWTKDAFRATVQLNDEPTFYIKYGDVIGRTFAFAFALLVVYTFVSFFKKYKKSL